MPYFGYECEQSRNVYLSLSDTGDNNWEICYGHIKSDEVDFNFSYVITESESELIVYETLFPQIYWPATTSMSLDDFDLSVVEKESITALKYLDCFQETHQFGDQDATYRIIWEESMQ